MDPRAHAHLPANKAKTSLISFKMDRARLPRSPELHENTSGSVALDYMWMKWQEAGGINPGYAYDTGLPAPASSNKRTPTAPSLFNT